MNIEECIIEFKKMIERDKDTLRYWKSDTFGHYDEPIKKLEKDVLISETLLTAYEKEKEKNKELSDKLTQKICKGVEEEILEEYRQTIINKDKEIEELKASHITTNNKATNTEKAKIFDVIENSIDTYIEKSKPYWEQIMTKDEMTIDEALTIIDDMYQDRYKIMSQKTEKETIVDLGKIDYIKFTNLEWASVRALREVQSLNNKLEKWEDKIKAKIEYYEKIDNPVGKRVLQSLLEKE